MELMPMPLASQLGHPPVDERHPVPVTPGKVAIWIFLATEVMFFTGLIGSYIVLRAGSPASAYSSLFPPGTPLESSAAARGLLIARGGADPLRVAELVKPLFDPYGQRSEPNLVNDLLGESLRTPGLEPEVLSRVAGQLKSLNASFTVVPLQTARWPRPYDPATNPLDIDLTAANTFVLIGSSVTMVLALSAIQRGDRRRAAGYLLGTLLLGGTFLAVQAYEYNQLLLAHHYPIGVSGDGHFRPASSLFATCFFTMTGFHGAHVAAGLLAVAAVLLRTVAGAYGPSRHAPIEIVGLYWHFVDVVWILLFTVVYLI
jgi:cytochrome c oxidase subunit 3